MHGPPAGSSLSSFLFLPHASAGHLAPIRLHWRGFGLLFLTACIGTPSAKPLSFLGNAGRFFQAAFTDGLYQTWGDMLLPFTAGTFLYVGTVAVIPELLETGPNKAEELRKTIVQFAAIAAGAGIMLFLSWHD